MHLLFPALGLAVVLVGCGGSSTPPTTPAPAPAAAAQPHEPAANHAPMLFDVAQLREGNRPGRVIEIRMEIEGKPTTIQRVEFTGATATDATMTSVTRDEAGNVLSEETATAPWAELHEHGKFPAAATTIQDNVSVTVPAGTFETRLYTVKAGDAIRRLWFSVELPGPPVQFETEQAGKVVMRAQMLRAR